LIRIGQEQFLLEARRSGWLEGNWHLVKNEQIMSVPLAGICYTIDGMTFEDLAALAEGQ
jgi:hypothetical protein